MIYIGIDTGTNTGIAIWNNRERSLEVLACVKIHEAMDIVGHRIALSIANNERIKVKVEDPRQRTWYEPMTREKERMRLQGVGSVKRDASIWDDYLADQSKLYGKDGFSYEMVAPKRNVTKLTHERFVAITGWGKRTNEHMRDAAMLVFGS